MKTAKAIELAGTASALAEILDITPSAVSQWGDEVPQGREWQLRVLRPSWFEPSKELLPKTAQKARV